MKPGFFAMQVKRRCFTESGGERIKPSQAKYAQIGSLGRGPVTELR